MGYPRPGLGGRALDALIRPPPSQQPRAARSGACAAAPTPGFASRALITEPPTRVVASRSGNRSCACTRARLQPALHLLHSQPQLSPAPGGGRPRAPPFPPPPLDARTRRVPRAPPPRPALPPPHTPYTPLGVRARCGAAALRPVAGRSRRSRSRTAAVGGVGAPAPPRGNQTPSKCMRSRARGLRARAPVVDRGNRWGTRSRRVIRRVEPCVCGTSNPGLPGARMFVPVPVPRGRRGESACAKWIQNDEIDFIVKILQYHIRSMRRYVYVF